MNPSTPTGGKDEPNIVFMRKSQRNNDFFFTLCGCLYIYFY